MPGRGLNTIFTECEKDDLYFCPGFSEYYELINRSENLNDVIIYTTGDENEEIYSWAPFYAQVGRGKITSNIKY